MSGLGNRDVIAFVAATDPDRARSFYEGVLGLRLVVEEQFALVFDANGTLLRVAIVDSLPQLPYTVLGWAVPELTAEVAGLVRPAG